MVELQTRHMIKKAGTFLLVNPKSVVNSNIAQRASVRRNMRAGGSLKPAVSRDGWFSFEAFLVWCVAGVELEALQIKSCSGAIEVNFLSRL